MNNKKVQQVDYPNILALKFEFFFTSEYSALLLKKRRKYSLKTATLDKQCLCDKGYTCNFR